MQTTRRGIAGVTVLVVAGAVFGATPSANASSSLSLARNAVVAAANVARVAHGCEPLKLSSKLSKAAQRHATDMANNEYFGHTSPDGTTSAVRITQAGFHPGGESLAFGYETAASAARHWLGAKAQRRKILNCDVTTIGVGYANLDGGYWVQDLGY